MLNENQLFVSYQDSDKEHEILVGKDLMGFMVKLWNSLELSLEGPKQDKNDEIDKGGMKTARSAKSKWSPVELNSVLSDEQPTVRPVSRTRKVNFDTPVPETPEPENAPRLSMENFPKESWPAEPLIEHLPFDQALIVRRLHPTGGRCSTLGALKCQVFTEISGEPVVEQTHNVSYASASFDAITLQKLEVLLPHSPLLDMILPEQLEVSPLVVFYRALQKPSYRINVIVYMNSLPLIEPHEIDLKRELQTIRDTGKNEPRIIGDLLHFDLRALHHVLVEKCLSARGRFLFVPVKPQTIYFYQDITEKYSADATLGFPCTSFQRSQAEDRADEAKFEWEVFARRLTFGGLSAFGFGQSADALAPLLPPSKTMRLLVEKVCSHVRPCIDTRHTYHITAT